jgi:hypothetical protein
MTFKYTWLTTRRSRTPRGMRCLPFLALLGLLFVSAFADVNDNTAALYVWTAEFNCPGYTNPFYAVKIGKVAKIPYGISKLGAPPAPPALAYYSRAAILGVMARVIDIAGNVAKSTLCSLSHIRIESVWLFTELAALRRRSAVAVGGVANHNSLHPVSAVTPAIGCAASHRSGDSILELIEYMSHSAAERAVVGATTDRLWRAIHSGVGAFHTASNSGQTEWFVAINAGSHVASTAAHVGALGVQAVTDALADPMWQNAGNMNSFVALHGAALAALNFAQVYPPVAPLTVGVHELTTTIPGAVPLVVDNTFCQTITQAACFARFVHRWARKHHIY